MKYSSIMLMVVAVAALLSVGCAGMGPSGRVQQPIGDPPVGIGYVERVELPVPGTKVGFKALDDEALGTDRFKVEAHENEVAVTIYDAPISGGKSVIE